MSTSTSKPNSFQGWRALYKGDRDIQVKVFFALSRDESDNESSQEEIDKVLRRWELKNPGWVREGSVIQCEVLWNPYIITVFDANTGKRTYTHECAISDFDALVNQQEWDNLVERNKHTLYRNSEEISYMAYMPTDELIEFLNKCRRRYYECKEATKYASHAYAHGTVSK